ncbi:thioredoxin-like protein [Syntrophus aciditrophicus SB]|uniref:Thioredoxin-like protein n=1 Tax=Syntrophus aciditrophicus (strain SB) TaxID=56780 RepID=Q2LWX3_SYNAS|nr:thioredoxin-like protein [Syntrophus aciditrophicus SB]
MDFELPDLEKRPFRLSQHRGKPVLLIFSTTWCAYCRSELPRFRDIHERYASGGPGGRSDLHSGIPTESLILCPPEQSPLSRPAGRKGRGL